MNSFILGFFYELLNRINQLDRLFYSTKFHKTINLNYRDEGVNMLADLKLKVQKILNRKEEFLIEELGYQEDLLDKYKSFNDDFFIIERDYYFVLKYYGETEVIFQKIVKQIYTETGQWLNPPTVTSFFTPEKYYWARPPHLLGIPANEEQNLLNLPDVYHEKGHFIANEYEIKYHNFSINTRQKIKDYFEEKIDDAYEKDKNPRAKALEDFYNFWLNKNWLEEFLCDMIATYFVGPAYAFTHIKIVLNASERVGLAEQTKVEDTFVEDTIYHTKSELHPADEARMRGIFAMLQEIGEGQSITKIKEYWSSLVKGKRKGNYYDLAYPEEILESLAYEIKESCEKKHNYNSYAMQCEKYENPISKILNEAWEVFLNDSSKYAEWQENALKKLGIH
jgi:hypothetical protein